MGATSAAVRMIALEGGRIRDIAGCLRFVAACHDRAGGFAERPGGEIGIPSTADGLLASAALDELPIFWREAGVAYFLRNARSFEDVRVGAEVLATLRTVSSAPRSWKDLALAAPPGAERVVALAYLGVAVPDRDGVIASLVDASITGLEEAYRVVHALHLLGEASRSPAAARGLEPSTLQHAFFASSILGWLP